MSVPHLNQSKKHAAVHNLGLGGSCVVTLLGRPSEFQESGRSGRDRMGYEHGYVARGVTREDVMKVVSKKAFSSKLAEGSIRAIEEYWGVVSKL